ncbi:hypothetical protein MMC28_004437 [Mycoblastus sanguinarius]|nr:hypothetical protein [Mycoblastus sanguinarius]
MSAKNVSSQLIKNIQNGAKLIAVEYFDKTTAWTRPQGSLSATIKSEFTQVAQENANSFNLETTRIAMKESEHQSDKDNQVHYTAFELDKDDNVLDTRHFVKEK